MESRHLTRSHNKTLLLYHIVCPVKYRREVLTDGVSRTLTEICLGIQSRYDINFLEIGTDGDHVHFLVQSVPTASPTHIVQTIKSILAKQLFKLHPEIKRMLWGGEFWTKGYYVNTVGQYANESIVRKYVQNQGKPYTKLHQGQPTLFEGLE